MVLKGVSIRRSTIALYIPLFVILCGGNTPSPAAAPKTDAASIVLTVSEKDALSIAEKYYALAHPKIEPDFTAEYSRIITVSPAFDGKAANAALCRENSARVAALISYTDAKYFICPSGKVFGSI